MAAAAAGTRARALLLLVAAASWLAPGADANNPIPPLDCSTAPMFVQSGPATSFSAGAAPSSSSIEVTEESGVYGMAAGWSVDLSVNRNPIGKPCMHALAATACRAWMGRTVLRPC